MANDNNLLVAKVSENLSYLDIYDQAAKLLKSVSLPNDFKSPLYAIQKADGEFVVSYRSRDSNQMCVSFLSSDGKIISQFTLRETVGLTDTQLFYARNYSDYFVIDMLLANVYIFDFDTMDWKLTNHSVIISNSSDEGSIEREIVGFRYSDGRNISDLEDLSYRQMVMLFWDTDNKILFLFEPTFGNLYLFDTKTLKWSQTNRRIMHHLSFSTRKKQFTVNTGHCVEIFALTKC